MTPGSPGTWQPRRLPSPAPSSVSTGHTALTSRPGCRHPRKPPRTRHLTQSQNHRHTTLQEPSKSSLASNTKHGAGLRRVGDAPTPPRCWDRDPGPGKGEASRSVESHSPRRPEPREVAQRPGPEGQELGGSREKHAPHHAGGQQGSEKPAGASPAPRISEEAQPKQSEPARQRRGIGASTEQQGTPSGRPLVRPQGLRLAC